MTGQLSAKAVKDAKAVKNRLKRSKWQMPGWRNVPTARSGRGTKVAKSGQRWSKVVKSGQKWSKGAGRRGGAHHCATSGMQRSVSARHAGENLPAGRPAGMFISPAAGYGYGIAIGRRRGLHSRPRSRHMCECVRVCGCICINVYSIVAFHRHNHA